MVLDFAELKVDWDINFNHTKVKVRNLEECERVQRAMFEKGYSWHGGSQKLLPDRNDIGALYFEDGTMSQTGKNGDHFETETECKEIKVEDILGKPLTDKQRTTKISKIVKEIQKDKDYFSCFDNDIKVVTKEVNEWDSFKLANWK